MLIVQVFQNENRLLRFTISQQPTSYDILPLSISNTTSATFIVDTL